VRRKAWLGADRLSVNCNLKQAQAFRVNTSPGPGSLVRLWGVAAYRGTLFLEAADEFQRLVGGDAPRDDQKNPFTSQHGG
jgi:hypothetical protein